MNKIDDGKPSYKIDVKKLFSGDDNGACENRKKSFFGDRKNTKVNVKMLALRCLGVAFAIGMTVILTLVISKGSKNDVENGGGDHLLGDERESEEESATELTSETESEDLTEDLTQSKETKPTEAYEILDMSGKEHGELYIKNKTGKPIVYDPYAQYEKYYAKADMRPLVLVLHTFDDQKYLESAGEGSGIVRIGEKIVGALNMSGIPAIHCSARHSGDTDTDSYNNAEESIEFYLEMYPSIKYILDVGVDSENDFAAVGNCGTDEAAQILFEVCGQNDESRDRNLFLSVKLRGMLSRGDMNLAREILVSKSVLNSRFAPYYLTVKIGTKYNTEKQAINSANALALTLAEYLNQQ